MILVLEVVGTEGDKLGAERKKEFHASGGTIGRLRDNTWVLPDPYVSSHHALIRFHNGAFHIEDTSTNGVFINSPDNRLNLGQPYALSNGDWIFIEPYEIRAALLPRSDQIEAMPLVADPFSPAASVPNSPPPVAVNRSRSAPQPLASALPVDEVDPLSLLGFEPRRGPT